MAALRPRKPGRGKSGLHGSTVPGNTRRGRPQGQCHRKQTAEPVPDLRVRRAARVKGCGKSAPRCRQRWRHGKPHREQDQIGMAGSLEPGALPRRHPGRLREAPGDGRPRGMVIPCREVGTEPGLQAVWRLPCQPIRTRSGLGRGPIVLRQRLPTISHQRWWFLASNPPGLDRRKNLTSPGNPMLFPSDYVDYPCDPMIIPYFPSPRHLSPGGG